MKKRLSILLVLALILILLGVIAGYLIGNTTLRSAVSGNIDNLERDKHIQKAVLDTVGLGIAVYDSKGALFCNETIFRLPDFLKGGLPKTLNNFLETFDNGNQLKSNYILSLENGVNLIRVNYIINRRIYEIKIIRRPAQQDSKFFGNEELNIVIVDDITQIKDDERRQKDLAANVSHELRTPLTVIKSYADILADTPDAEPELRTRFLDTISSETDRMTKIISDLLTLSKLDENANYSIPSDNIDIRSMVEGLVERLSLTAKKKNQSLTYTPINDVPNIRGDRDGLERVLTNIISNALKYTPTDGKIQIFSSKVYNDILIKISDTGIGISKEQLPNIFDRFFRVDKARSRDKGGTGLGLAIAKETIETTFHGKILINSQLNKGTDVAISIPIPKK